MRHPTDTRRRIWQYLQERAAAGDSPPIREIARALGLKSPANVLRHLRALEEQGLVRSRGRQRGYRLERSPGIPVVGQIAAGRPIASGEPEGTLAVAGGLFGSGELVALKVRGDSMTGAHIRDGDYVVIRLQPEVEHGQIAAVTVDGEGTLKRVKKGRRRLRLEPAAAGFAPLDLDERSGREARIFGRYVGLVRGSFLLADD